MSAELALTDAQKDFLILLLMAGVILLSVGFCSYVVWNRCCKNRIHPETFEEVSTESCRHVNSDAHVTNFTSTNSSDSRSHAPHSSSSLPSAPGLEDLERNQNHQNQIERNALLQQDRPSSSELPSYEEVIRETS